MDKWHVVLMALSTPYKGPSSHTIWRLDDKEDGTQGDREVLPRGRQRRPEGCAQGRALGFSTSHRRGRQPWGSRQDPSFCCGLGQQVS